MDNKPQRLDDVLASNEVNNEVRQNTFKSPPRSTSRSRAHAESSEASEGEKPKRTSSAYQYCLFLLSGQDYSEFKLRQKMKQKKYEAAEIDETITTLIAKNYLRPEEYKKLLAKKLMRKGKADSLIRRQVEQEHLKIDSEELNTLREDMGVSSDEMVTQLVNKKMRGKDWPTDRNERQKLQQKIYRFLLSRGFSYDDAKKAVKAIPGNEDSH